MKKTTFKMRKIALTIAIVLSIVTIPYLKSDDAYAGLGDKKEMMTWVTAQNYLSPPAYDGSLSNLWQGAVLYYGKNPTNTASAMYWNVLNPNETKFGNNGILMLSGMDIGITRFDGSNRLYTTSELDRFINETQKGKSLDSRELANTLMSINTKTDSYGTLYTDQSFSDRAWFAPTGWMMLNEEYGFSSNPLSSDSARYIQRNASPNDYYWLSSYASLGNFSGMVAGGNLYDASITDTIGARAATVINPSGILFVSKAMNGKQSNAVGPDALKAVEAMTDNDYKLTLKDTGQTLAVSNEIRRGNTVTLDYVATGTGQYLSAVVMDSSESEVVSYGTIKDISTEKNGQTEVLLPSDYDTNNYKIKLFTEEKNGDKYTDYASQMVGLTVPSTPILSVTLNKTELSLSSNEIETLVATINPTDTTEDKILTWSSSNPAVASVDNVGKVLALMGGTTTVTVTTSNGKTATCVVTVLSPITSIVLVNGNIDIAKGSTEELQYVINPEYTTDDKAVTWESSDPRVASVDGAGVVTAKTVGETKVTVTTSNGKTASCIVTVIIPIQSLSLNKNEIILHTEDSETLVAAITPNNATDDKQLTWDSSSSSIASVDKNGKVVAHASGEVYITVSTADGKKAKCKVTVLRAIDSVSLNKNTLLLGKWDTESLVATINPDDTTDSIILTWSSSHEKVATIDKDGVVTAHMVGTTEVKVKTVNGKTDTCKIEVVNVKETTVAEDVQSYPNPEEDASAIEKLTIQILETKLKYEKLGIEGKQDIAYSVAEKLHELVKQSSAIDTLTTVRTPESITNVNVKNMAESLNKVDIEKIIANTHTAKIELILEMIPESKVDANEKKKIEEALKEWRIGAFIDMKLVKTLVNSSDNTVEVTNVSTLAKPIKGTIDIPKNIVGKKEYSIFRVHDNQVMKLKDQDDNPDTFTLYTDKFSTYCMVYKEDATRTVTFDLQGGKYKEQSGGQYSVQVEDNSLILEYPNRTFTTKSGYVLDGWYTDTSYKIPWDFIRNRVTGDVVLYAKWKQNEVRSEKTNVTRNNADKNNSSFAKNSTLSSFTGDSTVLVSWIVAILISLLGIHDIIKKRRKNDN